MASRARPEVAGAPMTIPSILSLILAAAPLAGDKTTDTSGRPIPLAQAAFDVTHYDLSLRVDPSTRAIDGELVMAATIVSPTATILLDLTEELEVIGVRHGEEALAFSREGGTISIGSATLFREVGSPFEIAVRYRGTPRSAPNAPWRGGFTWAETSAEAPWIATSCQAEGADLWWPCKDQPDDEPDAMDLRFTVPDSLVVASNGRLVDVVDAESGWRTWHWHVSTPINNYGVAFHAAPYRTIRREYESIAGDRFPVIYWVLPENLEPGKILFEDILRQMAFYEEIFGPYPFRGDKYGVAETPHLGMEHQSIVSYGNRYRGNPWGPDAGFDFLHHHEFAHEWWGNLVTARHWNDFWIHEGFATYAQALYVERLHGVERYRDEMRSKRRLIRARAPMAPRELRSTAEMSGRGGPGTDVYYRGSWMLHTLRWLIGDEPFFRAMRRMTYPTPEQERAIDGTQCRFVTSDDWIEIVEEESELELDWFFDVHLRYARLPRLEHEIEGGELRLRWNAPADLPFPLPVPVRIGDELLRVPMPNGRAVVEVPKNAEVEIDPHDSLLRAR